MKKYILAGLLVWLPIAITIWVLSLVLGNINAIFKTLLIWVHNLFGLTISPILLKVANFPGIGLLVIFLVIFITGLFAANIVGKWWFKRWDNFIYRIPIVKSVYSTIKQISDTLLSEKGQSFKEAVLVEYPIQGMWVVAFVTGEVHTLLHPPIQNNQNNIIENTAEHLEKFEEEYISLFVPTTPNPTSGFLLLTKRSNTKILDISVEEALKYTISMGVLNVEPSLIQINTQKNK